LGRNATHVRRADNDEMLPWTLPLHDAEARAVLGAVRTATIMTIALTSGMRSSELMELRVGCRRPPQEHASDLVRYRLASRVVKGQPLGGVEDEWIVIEPAYLAAGLAEQLHNDPRPAPCCSGGSPSTSATNDSETG